MSDERMEQNRQPEKTDVVFFSPEMLRLADQHRREQQERLENCRQAAQYGFAADAEPQLKLPRTGSGWISVVAV